MRGLAVCYWHGGATEASKAKSDRAVEEFNRQKALARAVAQMGRVREVHSLDALPESVWTASAMVTGLRELVGELEPGYSTSGEGVAGPDHLGDARPHVFASMLREWTAELGRLSKLALDAGIDERRVRMAALEGETLARVVRAAVDTAAVGGREAGIGCRGRGHPRGWAGPTLDRMTGADDLDLAVTGRAIVRLGGPQAFARALRAAVEAAAEDEQARARGMKVGTDLSTAASRRIVRLRGRPCQRESTG